MAAALGCHSSTTQTVVLGLDPSTTTRAPRLDPRGRGSSRTTGSGGTAGSLTSLQGRYQVASTATSSQPMALTRARSPERSRTVVVADSTIAGPSIA